MQFKEDYRALAFYNNQSWEVGILTDLNLSGNFTGLSNCERSAYTIDMDHYRSLLAWKFGKKRFLYC